MGSITNSDKAKQKKSIAGYIVIKLQKIKDKEIVKECRKKILLTSKRKPVTLMANFSTATGKPESSVVYFQNLPIFPFKILCLQQN